TQRCIAQPRPRSARAQRDRSRGARSWGAAWAAGAEPRGGPARIARSPGRDRRQARRLGAAALHRWRRLVRTDSDWANPARVLERAMHDAVIIGGGHNGLVCAAYLAMAGRKVVVLERRGVVGGAAVTEEFHPGFRNSVASYTVSLLNPKVIADLRLAEHGLRIVERRIANFLPLDDGRHIKIGGGRTREEVAKFSRRD